MVIQTTQGWYFLTKRINNRKVTVFQQYNLLEARLETVIANEATYGS